MEFLESEGIDPPHRKPVTAETKSIFPFLQLPLELRNQIYLYLVHHPTMYKVNLAVEPIDMFCNWGCVESGFCSIAICLTNRQISQEALFILYSRNSFTFQFPIDLRNCGSSIGQMNTNSIRSIYISTESRAYPRWQFDSVNRSKVDTSWAPALIDCDVRRLTFLSVSKKDLVARRTPYGLSKAFIEAIKHIFDRDQEKGFRPYLEFCGYDEDVREHFPKDWLVTVKP
ncbi:MAG: hypothetical protein M1835_005579 [Candelina submexicana]|nr:MAG: hypothetical protein M1835_005579 [Candelina submexicana]